MSAERVAQRYAKALIEVLNEKDALGHVDAFFTFCDLAAGSQELTNLFANVTVNSDDKAKVATAVAAKMNTPELIVRFLTVIGRQGRLNLLAEIRQAVSHKLDQLKNIRSVRLTTAAELTADEQSAFSIAMTKALGGEVRVETHLDPDILGGAIAQVGSVVYDGSLSGQLKRLRADLVKENQ